MSKAIHMQDQVKNRINIIMHDDQDWTIDDIAQTAVSVVLVTVFLALGVIW